MITWYANSLYGVVLAWACKYFVDSFSSVLPWATCDNYWNTQNCTEIGRIDELSNNSSIGNFSIDSVSTKSPNDRRQRVPAAIEYWE